MDTTKNYQYENELSFNIEDVKTAIKSILETYKTRFLHSEKDLNDVFGTYNFGEVKCGYLVTLQKIDDNTTKIKMTCSSRTGFEVGMASLEGYTAEFLNILSAKLTGSTDEEMETVVNENNSDSANANISGCLSIISIAISIGFVLWIMFM